MKIVSYIRHKPFTINFDDNYTILEIASLFLKTDNDSVVIIKDKKPIYIITNSDLINYFLNGDNKLTIQEIIQKYPKKLITIYKDEDVYEAYKKMRDIGIEHLIVVDDEGNLLGEVFQHDLVIKFVEFALKDELTGLNNSRFLDTVVQRYNGVSIRIGVIFLDIDDFKHFNDKYGHKIGDEVIKFVGESIKNSIREVDFAFRYGGDEFVIMIFSQSREIVLKIGKRIFDRITSKPFKSYGYISVSVGIALYPDDDKNLEKVIELADKQLYIAKNSGKGRIETFS